MSNPEKPFAEVNLEHILPIIEEKLKNGGEVKFMPKGVSMLPLIRQGFDSVIIRTKEKPLGRGDIIFYRRPDGQFVIHRIVGKNKKGYILCGDNQFKKEYGVEESWIIGVVARVRRDNRDIPCGDQKQKMYTMFALPFRRNRLFLEACVRKVKGAIKKRLV